MAIVWITGARGFLGRHVARRFAAAGWDVAGIGIGSAFDVQISELPFVQIAGKPAWIERMIDEASLAELLSLTGPPAAVFHAAGSGAVAPSLADPYRDFRLSVDSTALMLDALRRSAPNAAFVLPSSSAVYGNTQVAGPIEEDTPLSPVSPYGAHKLCAEWLCRSISHSFGLKTAVIRFFSIYGPGLRKQLLWDVAGKISRAVDEFTLFGTGNETRDMLYIEDAAELSYLATQRATSQSLVLNGGTGVASSVQTIASELANAFGSRCQVRFNGDVRAGDPGHLQASTKRAWELGFRPRWSVSDGIEAYAAWWQNCARADVGT
ncbi:NAD-dependent epimerase/dehydratase family protein [Bradyrhizobium liaoningense]|uniref:NAD-dependent epimerase/dehydratase family protein n=1 Tax=Bradyrhizobium liaoningense TaxID=43992 RepID=UPI001BAE18D5|nr:NAD-dependent epimerase/dehydratase family protein [Bradyrhizobium liaoningense]MBR0843871.1 NAD-dependent epimerase/dehydratase family protein [Bradyrhizobium liaoningense]